jgi:opacity protein-like surface antigen
VDYRKFLVAAGLAVAAATPATAAPVAAAKDAGGKALILISLTLTKVADLEFGTVIESSISGTVTIPADGSARSVTGGVTPVASPLPARAQFAGAGTPGELVNIFLAPPASLKDANGDTLPISMSLESSNVTIDSTRAFFVGVGGSVSVAANQPDGDYTGTFTVLAQYN